MSLFKTLIVTLGLIFSSFAQAEQPLTKQTIEQWLNSIDQIQSWAESNEALLEDSAEIPDDVFSAEIMINQLKAANLYDEAEDIIQENGFDSPEQWADIQMRIMKAMISLEIEKEKLSGEIQAQLEQIRNNPHISDEQKQMTLNMMESSMKMMESMSNASPADKAAIKPYLQQIQQKLNDDEDM